MLSYWHSDRETHDWSVECRGSAERVARAPCLGLDACAVVALWRLGVRRIKCALGEPERVVALRGDARALGVESLSRAHDAARVAALRTIQTMLWVNYSLTIHV